MIDSERLIFLRRLLWDRLRFDLNSQLPLERKRKRDKDSSSSENGYYDASWLRHDDGKTVSGSSRGNRLWRM